MPRTQDKDQKNSLLSYSQSSFKGVEIQTPPPRQGHTTKGHIYGIEGLAAIKQSTTEVRDNWEVTRCSDPSCPASENVESELGSEHRKFSCLFLYRSDASPRQGPLCSQQGQSCPQDGTLVPWTVPDTPRPDSLASSLCSSLTCALQLTQPCSG